MRWSPGQRYLAEFLGTFGLLLAVTGAAVFTAPFIPYDPLARVMLISLAIAGGLTGMIYAFGDLSGAHFNPAVTVGMWAAGRFAARDVAPYLVAQVTGAIVGVGVIVGVAYGSAPLWSTAMSNTVALASQGYNANGAPYSVALGSVFLFEVAFTFFLVHVILFATRAENFSKNLAPLGIGLTLLMINLVGIPIDGASVNPARSFAPALLSAVWSGDQWAIEQDWLFWVAPIVGGLIAAMVDRMLRQTSA